MRPAGKLSEHAKGNALDIFAFALSDGRRVAVRPADLPVPAVAAFLAAVRATACGYFLTVLGPGSDAAHAEHLHLDLGPHGRSANYRICESGALQLLTAPRLAPATNGPRRFEPQLAGA